MRTMGYTLFLTVMVAFSGAAGRVSGSTPYISAPTDTLYSIIISGGLVYDGLGNLPNRTDVGVIGDRIVRLGDLSGALAERRIEAAGLAVVPGIIDIHSHATSETIESSAIVQRPIAENYLRQGVTTAIGGQDGSSTLAVGEFLAFLDQSPAAINVGLFIGHGSVRESVMGLDDRWRHLVPVGASCQRVALLNTVTS